MDITGAGVDVWGEGEGSNSRGDVVWGEGEGRNGRGDVVMGGDGVGDIGIALKETEST